MSPQTEEFAPCRVRLLTLIVVLVVTAGIALANLSSEPVITNQKPELPYGWPLIWYWRSWELVSEKALPGHSYSTNLLQWAVSRYSRSAFFTNLAAWLAIAAVATLACEWLVRRYRLRLCWQPRISTLIVLLIVAAPIALSNLSFDLPTDDSPSKALFGWPLIWYWHEVAGAGVGPIRVWNFSAARLAGSLAAWVLMLVVAGLVWEWLIRRLHPQMRWSLRTMLIAVGLAAFFCAWCAAARNRAREQDELIMWMKSNDGIAYVERWGPKWLDLVGLDPYRRQIVGVAWSDTGVEGEEEYFTRIARLPHLRYLDAAFYAFTPDMAAALGDMRELRMLKLDFWGEEEEHKSTQACLQAVGKLAKLEHLCLAGNLRPDSDNVTHILGLTNLKSLTLWIDYKKDEDAARECLAAINKLTQLERLYLTGWRVRRYHLPHLSGLTNLKSLTIGCIADDYPNIVIRNAAEAGVLAYLPELPQLETIDLTGVRVRDADLPQLAVYPCLKSLCLGQTLITGAGIAALAPFGSIERLALPREAAIEGLESLTEIARLRAVHIVETSQSSDWTSIELDRGNKLWLSPDEAGEFRHKLDTLRRLHPGIVIDSNWGGFVNDEFEDTVEFGPPWEDGDTPDRGRDYSQMWQFIHGYSP